MLHKRFITSEKLCVFTPKSISSWSCSQSFQTLGWRESKWFCHPALHMGHVSSASTLLFPYCKILYLKRQQDQVMAFRAWATFHKLPKQKSGHQHTKSKLSQMVKSWEQHLLLINALCANLQLGNFILEILFDKLHLAGATTGGSQF